MDINKRPSNCRNRLRDEGKAHPRSGCGYCGDGGIMGCPYEKVDLIIANDLEQTKIRVTEEMSETADSWQDRCETILSILGLDFGQNDPKPVLDGKMLKTADQIRNEAYVEAFDTIFQVIDMLKQEAMKNSSKRL